MSEVSEIVFYFSSDTQYCVSGNLHKLAYFCHVINGKNTTLLIHHMFVTDTVFFEIYMAYCLKNKYFV